MTFSMASAVTENPFSAEHETATGTPCVMRDARRVTHVARLVINHFVAGIDQRAQSDVHRFTDANGDQDFVLRIVCDAKIAFDALADRLAQFQQTQDSMCNPCALVPRRKSRLRECAMGVTKSGSPTPSEMTSFIPCTMSKKSRMPERGMARTLLAINLSGSNDIPTTNQKSFRFQASRWSDHSNRPHQCG